MKILVIGNTEAVLGFSLAGVSSRVVTTPEEANQALDEGLADRSNGIILVTEDIAQLITERMDQLKMHSTVPLVVEIPAPGTPNEARTSLSEMVMRAIGVKI